MCASLDTEFMFYANKSDKKATFEDVHYFIACQFI